MIKKIGIGVAVFFVFVIILIVVVQSSDKKEEAQSGQNLPSISPVVSSKVTVKATQKPQASGEYSVVKVVDGDTVDLSIDGKVERVRLIGMNTPETVDPRKPVECFGKEASNRAKELLTGKSVKTEADPTGDTRDKYDRLLLYIFLGDTTNFAKKMIMDGYAYEYTYDVKYKYQAEFKQAQKYAEDNKLGLWAPGVCLIEAPTASTPTQQTSCNIKGNISSGGKIYHLPGCSSYDKTVIDESAGEHWFCSEDEAVTAGWRKALNCP